MTREEAEVYGQKLLNLHWIVSVAKKKKFVDSKDIFKFSTGEAPREESKFTDITIEDFEQLKVIGKGGFGKVVLARQKATGKIFALKVMEKLKILEKPRDFKNLMSEKQILQNDNAFLVHLHYAFQSKTEFYLVMDFLAGGDLYFHLKKIGRFPEKAVQFIISELVLAIDYLHSCGIIYRDLKPQNILLGSDGHICLADFGLSKMVFESEAALHTACGTPSYSAPEVLEGSPYSKSVDWWSLGVVMYQLLVGHTPFEFNNEFRTLLNNITSNNVKYPSEILSETAITILRDGFLVRDTQFRLDDADVIKRHPFFKGTEWDKLEVKKVPSPIKIKIKDQTNAAHFDPKYTRLPVNEPKPHSQLLDPILKQEFPEFEFRG